MLRPRFWWSSISAAHPIIRPKRKAVKAAFPKHRIHEIKEPMFANVRGFQLAGQNYAASAMALNRDRGAGEAV